MFLKTINLLKLMSHLQKEILVPFKQNTSNKFFIQNTIGSPKIQNNYGAIQLFNFPI